MKYTKIYYDICEKGKFDRVLEYSEFHHIIPRCMGGSDDLSNLTRLSAREHYLAHYLLTKMHPNDYKILYAFGAMRLNTKYVIRIYTSKQYENIKKALSLGMKLNNPMYNKETAKKAIQTRKKRYDSGELSQRKISDKEKFAISERMKGDNNPTKRFPEKHNFANNNYVEGKHCYNNGIVNKYFNSSDEIPDGWVRGNRPYIRNRNGKESNHG